ncbi:MAG: PleD family two-component system response regulator [Bacteroidota bacterium]
MSKEAKTNGDKRTVLIVEDSVDFSNLLKFIIEDMGLEGIQAPIEVEDMVALAKQHKPSTILMDLALRRKGGMQFIEDLKADSATKNIPIIILTGKELSSKEVLELQIRGVKYLRKGRVEMDEIKSEILESAHGKKIVQDVAKEK